MSISNLERDRLQRACDLAARAASRARRWRLAIEAAPDDGADEAAAGRRRDARVAWEDAFRSMLGDVQSWYHGPMAGLDFDDMFAADPRLEALIDEFHQAAEGAWRLFNPRAFGEVSVLGTERPDDAAWLAVDLVEAAAAALQTILAPPPPVAPTEPAPLAWIVATRSTLNQAFGLAKSNPGALERRERADIIQLERRAGLFAIRHADPKEHARIEAFVREKKG